MVIWSIFIPKGKQDGEDAKRRLVLNLKLTNDLYRLNLIFNFVTHQNCIDISSSISPK